MLDRLMSINGAIGAFEMTNSGELIAHQLANDSELNETILDLLCHVSVANLAIATMQARGWEQKTGMLGFYPVEGFSLVGLNWTVIMNVNFGVVVPNALVDFDETYKILQNVELDG